MAILGLLTNSCTCLHHLNIIIIYKKRKNRIMFDWLESRKEAGLVGVQHWQLRWASSRSSCMDSKRQSQSESPQPWFVWTSHPVACISYGDEMPVVSRHMTAFNPTNSPIREMGSWSLFDQDGYLMNRIPGVTIHYVAAWWNTLSSMGRYNRVILAGFNLSWLEIAIAR